MHSYSYENSNLRNRSFKGQDLRATNFYGADIRGADFSNANLAKANFSHARTGIAPSRGVCLLFILLIIISFSGLIVGFSSAFPAFISTLLIKESVPGKELLITFGLFVLASFIFVIFRKGLGVSLGVLTIAIAVSTAFIAFVGSGKNALIAASVLQAVIIAIMIAGLLVKSLALSIFLMIYKVKALPLPITISIVLAIKGAQEGVLGTPSTMLTKSLIMAGIVSVVLIVLSTYISIYAIAGDRRYKILRAISVSLCTKLGTNFQCANLTDTFFDQAILPYSDFREAILIRTSWLQVKKIELSCIDGTYLKDSSIRQLATSRNGNGQVYDHKNLQGINLQAAQLVDASFIGTDLNEANLRGADLTRAKLVKTRLYSADLTKTSLTGACIQDWAISTDTKLEQVICTHIYMRLPTREDPDPWRKPDSRNEYFKEGDFTDFIAPIIKTLDLYRQQNVDPRRLASTFKSLDFYHYGGIDPAAAAIALKHVAKEHPEAELEIVTLEGRGKEKVRLQATVAADVDNSQLNESYFTKYQEISSLPYCDIQEILTIAAEKDKQIKTLESLLKNAIQQPTFYVETYQNEGGYNMTNNVENVNIGGDNYGIVNLGEISGGVTSTINKLPETSTTDSPSLKRLLTELQSVIENEEKLSNEDKVEALEEVKTLAEAGLKPEDNMLKKAAKRSIKALQGATVVVPEATKLIEAFAKLLPAISKLIFLA